MSQTVILGTARTPFGKMGGALASKGATELGGEAIERGARALRGRPPTRSSR